MKELLPENNPEKIEIHSLKEIDKEQKLVGRIVPYKGHTLFEINCTTGDITEAEYKLDAVKYENVVKGDLQKIRKVITKENCLYISCLNKKTAKKKFIKYLIANHKNVSFK